MQSIYYSTTTPIIIRSTNICEWNFAVYFKGNVYMEEKVGIRTRKSNYTLDVARDINFIGIYIKTVCPLGIRDINKK
jgi:hypothetical protein